MKTIVAFANTQGGKLIVGIDDKTHEIEESPILSEIKRKREWHLYLCGRYIQTGFSRENKRT